MPWLSLPATRHSYAAWLIMAYVPDKLVAEQLGHSVVVLHKIYSKQLVAAKDDKKREKINAALGFATGSPPDSAELQQAADYKGK